MDKIKTARKQFFKRFYYSMTI